MTIYVSLEVRPLEARFDEMHPRPLNKLANFVANHLSICFNTFVTQGCLPKDWKKAIVSHIIKTATKHKPENYRSVSLTSAIVNISKKIIRKELFTYLDGKRILLEKQHGFRIVAREIWCALKRSKVTCRCSLYWLGFWQRSPQPAVIWVRRYRGWMQLINVDKRLPGWAPTKSTSELLVVQLGNCD